MLLVQVRAANRCRLQCNGMLKLTVGFNKPILLNIKKRFAEVVTLSQIASFETGDETSR